MATSLEKNAICFGQKLGHDFPKTDGNCSQCGIGQHELNKGLQKIEYFKKQPAKGIHSEFHALAKEISEFCGEPKKFGMYLGIIKNIGLPRAYRIFAEMRQAKEIKTPGKLFLYLSAYKKPTNKKPDGKTRRKTKNANRKRAGKNTPQKARKRHNNNA